MSPPRRPAPQSGSRPAPSAWTPEVLRGLLRGDPRFQVLSIDGLEWIDPWTGTGVPAPFDHREPALQWLLANRPWQRDGVGQQPRPLEEVQLLRWVHWLRAKLPDPEEGVLLRRFLPDGRWLNPFTGDPVAGIDRPGGSITRETLNQLARVLHGCPQAEGGRMLSREQLSSRWRQLVPPERRPTPPPPVRRQTPPPPPPSARPDSGHFEMSAEALRQPTAPVVQVVSGYRIVQEIGRGGMSTVYRAMQMSMEREVALKVLDHHGPPDPSYAERFLREARAAGRINHPNVVTCYDVGLDHGMLYIAMELMTGGDAVHLAERNGGRLAEPLALAVIRDAVRGLSAIHATGLVHRDIKPANIFITADGSAKLGDLGLALDLDRHASQHTTEAIGTPAFMSPEQARGAKDLDIRSDICALGSCLFALLTGRPPYSGDTVFQLIRSISQDPVPDVRSLAPWVSDATAAIVARAMAKERGDRFRDPGEMLEALHRALGAPVPAMPTPTRGHPVIPARPSPSELLARSGLAVAERRGRGVVVVEGIGGDGQVLCVAATGTVPGERLRQVRERLGDPGDIEALARALQGEGIAAALALVTPGHRSLRLACTAGAEALLARSAGPEVLRRSGAGLDATLERGGVAVLVAGCRGPGLVLWGALVASCDRPPDAVAAALAPLAGDGALVVLGGG